MSEIILLLSDEVSIHGYYRDHIVPLDRRFSKYTLGDNRTVVCPLHDDHDPSLGVIKNKDKTDRFHCFGCGASGTVVDLHRRIQGKYKNTTMNEDQASKDLARMYDIDLSELATKIKDRMAKWRDREIKISRGIGMFSIVDFSQGLREFKSGKSSRVEVDRLMAKALITEGVKALV